MSESTLHISASTIPRAGDTSNASSRLSQVSPRVLAEFIGVSAAAEQVRRRIADAALDDSPQWIAGERGTGTALAARLIHAAGPRAFHPFIMLDCRVLTSELLQDELFGDGPNSESPGGWLRDWRGGTLFIDHADEMPLPVQKRLAAALVQLGHDGRIPAQRPRLIVASHAGVDQPSGRGAFCPEFLALFSSPPLVLPSLRSRTVDLPLLVEHFVVEFAAREGRPPRRLAADTIPLLERYGWPGNVRELRNVVERACAVDSGTRITAATLEPWMAVDEARTETCGGFSLREMERHLIETTFARCGGNRERTAQALQIGLRTLSGKLREYGYPPRGGPGSNRPDESARAA